MKKSLSKKLAKAVMDRYFLSYCYRASQLSVDFMSEKIDIQKEVGLSDEERARLLTDAENDYRFKVEKASKSFHKGVAYWSYLYAKGDIPDED